MIVGRGDGPLPQDGPKTHGGRAEGSDRAASCDTGQRWYGAHGDENRSKDGHGATGIRRHGEDRLRRCKQPHWHLGHERGGWRWRRVTQAKGYDGGPFFAPDGKKLVYRSDRRRNDLLQVFTSAADGSGERAVTNDEHVNWGPYWHPDNRHIIFATSRYGHTNYDLLMVDTATGVEERVTFADQFLETSTLGRGLLEDVGRKQDMGQGAGVGRHELVFLERKQVSFLMPLFDNNCDILRGTREPQKYGRV